MLICTLNPQDSELKDVFLDRIGESHLCNLRCVLLSAVLRFPVLPFATLSPCVSCV
jgi:hypothetical protein